MRVFIVILTPMLLLKHEKKTTANAFMFPGSGMIWDENASADAKNGVSYAAS
jgi:hypothetical protein